MKSQPTQLQPTATSQISGKYIIIGVVTIALAGAAASWWFRYAATHRAAEFWGPTNARLIRDAPQVFLYTPAPPHLDVSSGHGLVHLRNALIQDISFDWPAVAIKDDVKWEHGLIFQNPIQGKSLPLFFSSDFHWVTVMDSETMLSCAPIAAGLREMFDELSAKPASDSAK